MTAEATAGAVADAASAPRDPDPVRAALAELVRLKDIKARYGETDDYRANKDRAWDEARRVLALARKP